MKDPTLSAILSKANEILTSEEVLKVIAEKKDGLGEGAEALVKQIESMIKDKEKQKWLKGMSQSGINMLRIATADKVYAINQGFKFHVRSEPTTSGKKKNGVILRSGDIFTVSELVKSPSGKQTYLKLGDGRGWVFTDHPKEGDDRKLVTMVKLNSRDSAEQSDDSEGGEGGPSGSKEKKVNKASKSMAHRGKKLLDLTGKRYLGRGADDLLKHGSRIMENKLARAAFLREIKDASVEFLLSYLPTIKVQPIEGEQDGFEYKLWDIDLSGFKVGTSAI
jgi:hypothetical protein